MVILWCSRETCFHCMRARSRWLCPFLVSPDARPWPPALHVPYQPWPPRPGLCSPACKQLPRSHFSVDLGCVTRPHRDGCARPRTSGCGWRGCAWSCVPATKKRRRPSWLKRCRCERERQGGNPFQGEAGVVVQSGGRAAGACTCMWCSRESVHAVVAAREGAPQQGQSQAVCALAAGVFVCC